MKTGKLKWSVSNLSTLLATIRLPIESKIPIAKSSNFTRVRFVQTKDWSKTSTHSKQLFRNVRLLQPTFNRLCSFPNYYDFFKRSKIGYTSWYYEKKGWVRKRSWSVELFETGGRFKITAGLRNFCSSKPTFETFQMLSMSLYITTQAETKMLTNST